MFYNIGKVFAGDLYIYGSSRHGNPEIVELLFKRSEDMRSISKKSFSEPIQRKIKFIFGFEVLYL